MYTTNDYEFEEIDPDQVNSKLHTSWNYAAGHRKRNHAAGRQQVKLCGKKI